jgi:hypothetical protein
MGGEDRMVPLVAGADHVALAVGNDLEDRRGRAGAGRAPEAGGQADAIRHRNPEMLGFLDDGGGVERGDS